MDIEEAADIKIISRHRGRATRGGGAALALTRAVCNFKVRKIKNPNKYEVLCTTGNVANITSKVVVLTMYLPPRMLVSQVAQFNEWIATEIAAIKISGDPILIVAGNLNGRSVEDAMLADQNLLAIATGPTRSNSMLDVVYSNEGGLVQSVEVREPLETEGGLENNHGFVHVCMVVPTKKDFEWIRRKVRMGGLRRILEGRTGAYWRDWDRMQWWKP